MARLILTEAGEDVDVGGNVTVIGTRSGGEVITILRGAIALDASFNAGGDTLRLPDEAGSFTVRMSGSQAILEGPGVKLTVPIGTAGLEIAFTDATRLLLFDPASGLAKLGSQTITSTLANVQAQGAASSMAGTEGADYLMGTYGDDVIDGLGGNDIISGSAGNDIIRGGAGDDHLTGSLGNDELHGGAGADYISDNDGASTFVDGGTGNDHIHIINDEVTTFQLIGGDGDDHINVAVGSGAMSTIDAGPGSDFVVIATLGMNLSVRLGPGQDELMLAEEALTGGNWGLVTLVDFEAGPLGEKVDLLYALTRYANWDQSTDPFSSGYLRLIDRSGHAVLQVDRDGSSSTLHRFKDLIVFTDVGTAALTRENFGGFDPRKQPSTSLSADAEVSETMEPTYGQSVMGLPEPLAQLVPHPEHYFVL
jgi:Ca2+-binding RTX toxin-like protein